jgi:LemA protein
MRNVILVVLVLVGLFVLIAIAGFAWYVAGYNEAVTKDQAVKQSWADVDAQLKRRYDLIPNLVATVKGYAQHEETIFTEIADARKSYFSAATPADQIKASGQLEGFLSRLLMLQENYPNLKANESFLSLQDELAGTENRISVARTRYNAAVKELNAYVRSFFGSFFAAKAGVAQAEYFEAPKTETAAPPKVDFQKLPSTSN